MANKVNRQKLNRRHGILAIAAVVFTLLLPAASFAQQPAGVSPRPFAEPVEASLLAASPGDKVYQSCGHAALRLRCDAFGLDNVFSFETEGDNPAGHTLGSFHGRFNRISLPDYVGQFAAEGRGVTEYPLNLSDSQVRELWRLLDQEIARGYERDFNFRWRNCSSELYAVLGEAIAPDRLVVDSPDLLGASNFELYAPALKPVSPWSLALITLGLGGGTDQADPWQVRLAPVMMDRFLGDVYIESPDSSRRPLLAAPPRELSAPRAQAAPLFTPPLAALLLLIFSIALSALDAARRCRRFVRVADRVLLAGQAVASLALVVVALVPASIASGFNWMLIPLNPLPAVVWCLWRGKRFCSWFFLAYGVACALFVAAPLFTDQADLWSSLLSAAIAVRVLSKSISIIKPK